jgi:hypothetical protein
MGFNVDNVGNPETSSGRGCGAALGIGTLKKAGFFRLRRCFFEPQEHKRQRLYCRASAMHKILAITSPKENVEPQNIECRISKYGAHFDIRCSTFDIRYFKKNVEPQNIECRISKYGAHFDIRCSTFDIRYFKKNVEPQNIECRISKYGVHFDIRSSTFDIRYFKKNVEPQNKALNTRSSV